MLTEWVLIVLTLTPYSNMVVTAPIESKEVCIKTIQATGPTFKRAINHAFCVNNRTGELIEVKFGESE